MDYTDFFQYLKNWFATKKYVGVFKINADGTITDSTGAVDFSEFLQTDQFVRIIGSTFNDGVARYPIKGGTPEVFDGAVWAMAVPPSVIALCAEIQKYNVENAKALNSPYASESFGGYSYTKSDNGGAEWQNHFASRLNKWRKL